MNNITIALTGANGFIGRSVRAKWSIEDGKLIPWEGDILETSQVEAFLEKYRPQAIIHLAGAAQGDTDQLFTKNVLLTQKLLSATTTWGVKHLVFASSGAVYGNTGSTPATEGHQLQPNTEYGLSKYLAEEVIHFFQRQASLTVTTLRLPSIYGPGNTKGVVFQMQKQIRETRSLTIDGDGKQIRSFVHVDDVAQALIAATKQSANAVFNIGGWQASIKELATVLSRGKDINIKYRKNQNALTEMVLDYSLAKKSLSFSPANLDFEI